ncbi:MAG TPA: serine/threonine protein kinase, partial [Pilimelia sp.]|nr:serine/threonine protein kinase [Pilimelia sp.]
ELDGVAHTVDGDPETQWETDHYTTAKFGNLKPGMGVLINLGSPRAISSVKVQFSAAGARTQIRWGTSDHPSTATGDKELVRAFKELAPLTVAGATHAFGDFDPDQRYQYLLVWVTEMPDDNGRGFHIGIQEITVEGPDA